jgi:hypothetical protein
MPIKPIDFQIMIPRTVDASKTQNDEFSKVLSLQKSANNNVQHESEKALKQVQHREKSYKTDINKDGRGNQRSESDSKEHEDKQNKEETDKKDSMNKNHATVHIDIKI